MKGKTIKTFAGAFFFFCLTQLMGCYTQIKPPQKDVVDIDTEISLIREDEIIKKIPEPPIVDQPLSPTSQSNIQLTGTAAPGILVKIVGGQKPVKTRANDAGEFSVDVSLLLNKINRLSITAINHFGKSSQPIFVEIEQIHPPKFEKAKGMQILAAAECRINPVQKMVRVIPRSVIAEKVIKKLEPIPTDPSEPNIIDMIQLHFSNYQFNHQKKIFSFDVTLENISNDSIFTPLKVVLKSLRPGPPTIRAINADGSSQNEGVGAFWHYSGLVGADRSLVAGETSTTRNWQFKNPNMQMFSFVVEIQGRLVGPGLPPNPAEVAPPIDRTVATTMHKMTEFLYTGLNPLQTGIDPDIINPKHIAVLRGKVITRDEEPLEGVSITVLNHSEYGETLSREDGMYDLAVNGGGMLTLKYEKPGFLSAQRQEKAPWRDFAWLPKVALIPLDTQVTTIDFSEPMQVAQGSVVTDEDGTRQSTMLFKQGMGVEMVLPDGSTQPLSCLDVRGTEFSVGPNGPDAMPQELPPLTAYTYCVEISADEAIAAGAVDVHMDQPMYYYEKDFIGFPAGSAVPVGYYDKQKGQWIASENGRVIEILSITEGLANIDTDGDSLVDNQELLDSLNITDAEREKLANLYPIPPQRLWRVPMDHFTPYDCNWPYGPPGGAGGPGAGGGGAGGGGGNGNGCGNFEGSIIKPQSQILGESIPIVGTPFSLNYASDRVKGCKEAYSINITLSGDSLHKDLQEILLEISVADRDTLIPFPPDTNQTYTFIWDGKDDNNRTLQGKQPITIRIGYVYLAEYYPVESDFEDAFNRVRGQSGSGDIVDFEAIERDEQVIIWQTWTRSIGQWDAQADLGGWTLDVHHKYDPHGKTLFLGNGEKHSDNSLNFLVVNTVAGGGNTHDDGVPATDFYLDWARGIVLAPDGGFYISGSNYNFYSCIFKIDPNGIIYKVAGTGRSGYSGDGGPASEAQLDHPSSIAIASDGSLYIAEWYNHCIRRIDPEGIITTIAGCDVAGYEGDNDLAITAKLRMPYDVAVAPDGGIYIADTGNSRIRYVGTDGIITTVAGSDNYGYDGDEGLATEARLHAPQGIAVDPDGNLYIVDSGNNRIRHVGIDGIITTVAGSSIYGGYSGDGGEAINAKLDHPSDVVLAPDGGFYIADDWNNRIRYVSPNGMITTFAGNGSSIRFEGDGSPATNAEFSPEQIALTTDNNSLFIMTDYDYDKPNVICVSTAFPEYSDAAIGIPSEDGSELYHFDLNSRHLRTLNALTGVVLYQFAYDDDGRIIMVEDGDGNITTIERNDNGEPIAIVSPYGQRTNLGLDQNGYLSTITNPGSESYHFEYTADGLLTSITKPLGNSSHYTYNDSTGRLEKAEDPNGGYTEFRRIETDSSYLVTRTSALGRTHTYSSERLSTGDVHKVHTYPSGIQNEEFIGTDGSRTVTYSNNAVVREVSGPDPRWGMLVPLQDTLAITTPSGLKFITETERTVTLSNPDDPMSLEGQNTTISVNGRDFTSEFDALSNELELVSPEGRETHLTFDSLGKLISHEIEDLFPVTFTYNSQGYIETITRGDGDSVRHYSFTYDEEGNLDTITDPLLRTTQFEFDLAQRLTQIILPGGREVNLTKDSNGNTIAIQPPDKAAHSFKYLNTDRLMTYDPPDVGLGQDSIHFNYNLEGQINSITYPDNRTLLFHYNDLGQLDSLETNRGWTTITYDSATGLVRNIMTPRGDSLNYSFDGFLLTEEKWSGTINGTITNTYDDNFHLDEQSVNGEQVVGYSYDDDGLITQAGELTISHDPNNGFISNAQLNNVNTAYTYNGFGELESQQVVYGTTEIYNAGYYVDEIGRIIHKTETIEGVIHVYEYEYDEAGRLESVQENDIQVGGYTYDLNSNRLTYSGAFGQFSGVYDAQDRLTQYGESSFTYNENGQLVSETTSGHTTLYDYDVLENLRVVELSDGKIIEYVIDGLNRRIGKKVNSNLVLGFLYADQYNPIAQLAGNGQIVSRFVYGTRAHVPDYMVKNGHLYRIISDHLGSVRLVVNVSIGDIVQRIDYDEFGRVLRDTNPGFQPFGFAGGIYDPDTKLVRFGKRDYYAKIGRWTTKDPVLFGGGSANLYSYVTVDPINRIDPNGLGLLGDAFDIISDKWSETGKKFDRWVADALPSGFTSSKFENAVAGIGDAGLEWCTFGLLDPGPALRDAFDIETVDECSDEYQTSRDISSTVLNVISVYRGVKGLKGDILDVQLYGDLPVRAMYQWMGPKRFTSFVLGFGGGSASTTKTIIGWFD